MRAFDLVSSLVRDFLSFTHGHSNNSNFFFFEPNTLFDLVYVQTYARTCAQHSFFYLVLWHKVIRHSA